MRKNNRTYHMHGGPDYTTDRIYPVDDYLVLNNRWRDDVTFVPILPHLHLHFKTNKNER